MVRRLSRPIWLVAGWPAVAPGDRRCRPPRSRPAWFRGVVNDDKGQPVEGAKVTIDMTAAPAASSRRKTNKKGEFIQIGLAGGAYKVHGREGQARRRRRERATVSVGAPATVDLVLGAGGSGRRGAQGGRGQERRAEESCSTKASPPASAGKHDEAIAKFTSAVGDQRRPATTATTTSASRTRRRRTTTRPKRPTRRRSR